MRALLHDLSRVDDENLVRVADGGEAVCNDEGCASLHQLEHRVLNLDLGASIDGRSGLVQDQQIGIGQNGARDGDELALSLRDVACIIGQHSIVSLRQVDDEAVRIGHARGLLHLFVRRVQAAIADVFPHGFGKKIRILQHHAHAAAQRIASDLLNRRAVDENRTAVFVVEAGQKLIEFDLATIRDAKLPVITPVIVTNTADFDDVLTTKEARVNTGDYLLTAVK